MSFSREVAWEYDEVSGTGHVRLGTGGRLRGNLRIKHGDDSNFIADRAREPDADP